MIPAYYQRYFFPLAFKEIRSAFDLFKLAAEEKNDFPENNQKREEIPLECKTSEDPKTKGNKQVLKERRNTRDETDTWVYIAAEGEQDTGDSSCQTDDSAGECERGQSSMWTLALPSAGSACPRGSGCRCYFTLPDQ